MIGEIRAEMSMSVCVRRNRLKFGDYKVKLIID